MQTKIDFRKILVYMDDDVRRWTVD